MQGVQQCKYQDQSWLREKYWEEGMSLSEMAELCDVTPPTIRNWMEEYDIERRSSRKPQAGDPEPKHRDEEWLREKYVEEGKSQAEIADLCDVSQPTIGKWLREYGFDTGSCGNSKLDERLDDEDWLREKYVEKKISASRIARLLGCSSQTVRRKLRRADIEIRTGSEKMTEEVKQMLSDAHSGKTIPEEVRRKMSESHTREGEETDTTWRQTVDWKIARESVIRRDAEKCTLCGMSRSEHQDEYGRDIHVHHVTPVSVGGSKFDPFNLETLCSGCHHDAHSELNY